MENLDSISKTQLHYIVALADYRNFAKAADHCFVTQPTLSMQIQKVEEVLGTLLFNRSQRPLQLTPVGVQVEKQARRVLHEFSRISEISREHRTGVSGSYRIGVIPTIAPYLLPLILNIFEEEYPEAQLKVEELTTDSIIREIENMSMDAAILATPLSRVEIHEQPLYYEPFYVLASKAHRLSEVMRVPEEMLDLSDAWMLQEGHCFREQFLNLCGSGARGPLNSETRGVVLESGSLETAVHLVERGRGYTLVPYLAWQYLKSGVKNSQIREFETPFPTREISLIYHKNLGKRKIVDVLESLILNTIPKELITFGSADKKVVAIQPNG